MLLALSAGSSGNSWAGSPAPPSEPSQDKRLLRLALTGDVALAWRRIPRFWKELPLRANPLRNLKPYFEEADLAVSNMEGVLMRRNPKYASPEWNLWAPPAGAHVFAQVGVDLVSTANNHAADGRAAGLHETLRHLRATGVATIGTGASAEEARQPYLFRKHGACIAIVPATTKVNLRLRGDAHIAYYRRDKEDHLLVERVRKVQAECSFVIAYIHWGRQFKHTPTSEMQSLGHRLIDAGASMVVGHHPHVWATVEHYKDGIIAYSLGNLMFCTPWLYTRRTGILSVLIDPKPSPRVVRLEVIPVHNHYPRPWYVAQPASEEQTLVLRELLAKHSRQYRTEVSLQDGRIVLSRASTAAQ